VWVALFANVLAFSELPTLLPTTIGRMATQGRALVLAFVLALWANPWGVLRPNLYLVLLTMLAVSRPDREHSQRVSSWIDLPCLPPHQFGGDPLAHGHLGCVAINAVPSGRRQQQELMGAKKRLDLER
jgi:hypothetical protein